MRSCFGRGCKFTAVAGVATRLANRNLLVGVAARRLRRRRGGPWLAVLPGWALGSFGPASGTLGRSDGAVSRPRNRGVLGSLTPSRQLGGERWQASYRDGF